MLDTGVFMCSTVYSINSTKPMIALGLLTATDEEKAASLFTDRISENLKERGDIKNDTELEVIASEAAEISRELIREYTMMSRPEAAMPTK